MAEIDIAEIDRDFLGVTRSGTQLLDLGRHRFLHPPGWYVDGGYSFVKAQLATLVNRFAPWSRKRNVSSNIRHLCFLSDFS